MIICCALCQLSQSGKQSSVSSFKDSSISTSLPIIDLIDAIKPRVVDYTLVNLDCASDSAVSTQMNSKLCTASDAKLMFRDLFSIELARLIVV